MTLEINNTAINRYVSEQYDNLPSYLRNKSGNFQGLSYTIALAKPLVTVSADKIELFVSLAITSSDANGPIYNNTFAATPEITIPSETIYIDTIVTQYVDLYNAISHSANSLGIADSRLIQVIADFLEPYHAIMMKGNAIQQGNERWINSTDIKWTTIGELTYQLVDGSILLTIVPKVTAVKPDYNFNFIRASNKITVTITSNNSFTIKSLELLDARSRISVRNVTATNSYNNTSKIYTSKCIENYPSLGNYGSFTYRVVLVRQGFEQLYEIFVGTCISYTNSSKNLASVNVQYGE